MSKVKSANRTFRFLEFLANNRSGLTFTEIQNALEAPKSSVFSLIKEFLENDYIMYDEEAKKYYAGIEFVKLCAVCIGNIDLSQVLSILTKELSQEINQTCHVGIIDNKSIVYLSKYEVNNELSLMYNVGLRLPAHCTSVGKMLLSQYSNEEIKELYKDYTFQKLTEYSVGDIDTLIDNLNKIRNDHYALELREANMYAGCVALPLYQQNKMFAAFSVTFPAYTLEQADLKPILEIMNKHKKLTENRLFAF